MSRTRLSALALILGTGTLAVAAVSFAPLAQEPPTPTKEHEMLQKSVGEYEGMLSLTIGGQSMEMKAKETITGIGPFWTQGKIECEYGGEVFVGSSTLGYDPAKKKFVGTYIESMSPELCLSEGAMSADGKTLVMHWEGPDPMTGKRVKQRRETTYTTDGYTKTLYKGDGAGEKSVTITMKRKAQGEAKGPAKGAGK